MKKNVSNESSSVVVDENLLINPQKMMVVDLFSGRYTQNKEGHEYFNLKRNRDGMYYGYCPPKDTTDICKLGAKKKDQYVDGVLIIYTKKLKGSSNREIIAFCTNARVYRKRRFDKSLGREVEGDTASYTIVSDNMRKITDNDEKFIIYIKKFNSWMFRRQRYYSRQYPQLDIEMISYIFRIISNYQRLLFVDDDSFQMEVNDADISKCGDYAEANKEAPTYIGDKKSKMVAKKIGVSKRALINAGFKCELNPKHKTFITRNNLPYMEGHHLIPCTPDNTDEFWNGNCHRNIDCVENVVCLCPTCHRELHYGKWEDKKEKIERLYNERKERLEKAGIKIGLEEMMGKYR